jgi:hypothetical protein
VIAAEGDCRSLRSASLKGEGWISIWDPLHGCELAQARCVGSNRRVPQVSLLRPGIRATNPDWKPNPLLCHPDLSSRGADLRCDLEDQMTASCTGHEDRVPHISLVFREMWDTTVPDVRLCRLFIRSSRPVPARRGGSCSSFGRNNALGYRFTSTTASPCAGTSRVNDPPCRCSTWGASGRSTSRNCRSCSWLG